MKRRQFIQYAALGSSFSIANELLYPKPADAILFAFVLKLLSKAAMRSAISAGLRSAGSSLFAEQQRHWYQARRDAQLAQQELIKRSFTDISAADVRSPYYDHVVFGTREEAIGIVPAISFSSLARNQIDVASLSGPAAIGMVYAMQYLAQNTRMSSEEIQESVFPTKSHGSSWESWQQSYAYTKYETVTSQNGMKIEYRKHNSSSQAGEIVVNIDAGHRFNFGIKLELA